LSAWSGPIIAPIIRAEKPQTRKASIVRRCGAKTSAGAATEAGSVPGIAVAVMPDLP
jgi:hypothetical protein